MTQLTRTFSTVLGIAFVLSAVALAACGGQTQQEAPIDTATPTVIEKTVEVEKVVEKIVEVVKEVEVPVPASRW